MGAAPPALDCRCRSFLFLFVFARELGPFQKLWAKSGEFLVLGRRCLGPREKSSPPPPNFKIVPGPLGSGHMRRIKNADTLALSTLDFIFQTHLLNLMIWSCVVSIVSYVVEQTHLCESFRCAHTLLKDICIPRTFVVHICGIRIAFLC